MEDSKIEKKKLGIVEALISRRGKTGKPKTPQQEPPKKTLEEQ